MVQVTAAEPTAVLQLGEKGEADVLLLNSSKADEEFVSKGYGKERSLVMHTNYILVGSKNDPAAIKGISVLDAFTTIYNTQTAFVSCGDNSTVKKKEVAIWKKAGLTPAGDWYTKTGQEIAATLQVASEKGAYTLSDLSTFLNQKDTLQLDIMIEKDATLISAIYVITVNPKHKSNVNYYGAKDFADFLESTEGQQIISNFGVDKYNRPIFIADAGKTEKEIRQ